MSNETSRFAKDFFENFKEVSEPTSHQEWLLREYSKLMHRELQVKQMEKKIYKSDSSSSDKTNKVVNNGVNN